ncbi:MAG: hypothetical protein K0S46_1345 [Moraxellaceae bacterium]|jgi:hypothetical protein|nr:hypothetical protein [Moraxellaceae bacterium]
MPGQPPALAEAGPQAIRPGSGADLASGSLGEVGAVPDASPAAVDLSVQATRQTRPAPGPDAEAYPFLMLPELRAALTAVPDDAGPATPPLRSHALARSPVEASCLRRDESGRFMGWMDYQHCVFSGHTLTTARWLDDLFGDWHEDEASMQLRIVSQAEVVEGEGIEPRLTVRASARLPNAKRRLRLIVTEEADDVAATDAGVPGGPREADSRLSAALRWVTLEKAGVESDFDLGVKGLDPPDFFARIRARKSWGLTRDSILRFGQTLRYGSETEERAVSQLDIERALGRRTVLRFGNLYDYAADTNSDGFLWTHGVSLSRALGANRSVSGGVAVRGHTQPDWRGESWGPWLAYRRSFLRPYLFVEVEPRYTWYREKAWGGVVSAVLRVEMQLGFRR